MRRFGQLGLSTLTSGPLFRVGQDVQMQPVPQLAPRNVGAGWRDYEGPGWYVIMGPPQGLSLVIRDTTPDADGLYRSTKTRLMPGTRVEVTTPGAKPGRAIVSRYSTNGQIQEIGPNKVGYFRRLNYEGYFGQQLLVRQDPVSNGASNSVSGYRFGQLAPLTDVPGYNVSWKVRTRSGLFSGYVRPGWYRLTRPKSIKIHTRVAGGFVDLYASRILPAGTMVELDQNRKFLPPAGAANAPSVSTNSKSAIFVSKFIADGKIYRIDDSSIAWFRTGCDHTRAASGPAIEYSPQFIPSAPLGEFVKSAAQPAMPIAAPSPLVPLSQVRPGIAVPVAPGRDIGDPVRPPAVNLFSAIPQGGLSMSRAARFGQLVPRYAGFIPVQPGRDIGDPVSPAIPRVNRYEKQYYRPGLYRITVPGGLRAAVPDARFGTRPIGNLAAGMTIQVVEDLGNSWLRISSPFFGFVQVSPEGGLISVSPGAVPLYGGLRYPSVTPRRYSRAMIGQERIDGFNGPGMYRVTSPIGLNVHQQTSRSSFAYGVVKQGWDVEVLRNAGNGWFEVRANVEWFKWQDPPSGIPQQRRDNSERIGPVTGYICGSCAENPIGPGPWLVPISAGGASHPAPAPYVPQYRVPVSALRFPRAIPARAGMIGQSLFPSRRRGVVG